MKNFLKFIQNAVENVKEEAEKALENAQDLAQDVTANLQKQLEEAQKNQQNEQQATAENEGVLGGILKGFLGALENAQAENDAKNNSTAPTTPTLIAEEPITEIKHTITVKGKSGEQTIHIAAHAELIGEEVEKHIQHFLTINKDQFVFHTVQWYSDKSSAYNFSKTVINKNQIGNRVSVSQKEVNHETYDSYLYTLTFALKTKVLTQYIYNGEDLKTYERLEMDVNTTIYDKITALQSTLLGVQIGAETGSSGEGEATNKFIFIGGDGSIVKTTDYHWAYNIKSPLYYLETIFGETNAHQLVSEEVKNGSCTVTVTHIPLDAVGDYTKIQIETEKAIIPLTKPVQTLTYKDLEKPKAQEVTEQLVINFKAVSLEEKEYFLAIIGRELPQEVQDKFFAEIFDPTIEKLRQDKAAYEERLRVEKEQARLRKLGYDEESIKAEINNNSSSSPSKKEEKKQETKNNSSSSNAKAKNIAIKVKNDTGEEMNVYNAGSGGNYRLQKNIITTIKMDEGDKLLEYNNQKKGRVLLVAEPSMDGKVQLISKL